MSGSRARQDPEFSTWGFTWRVACFRPGLYFGMTAVELLIFSIAPLISGALVRAFFDALTGTSPLRLGSAAVGVWGVCGLIVANDVIRAAVFMFDFYWFFAFQDSAAALLRRNLFDRILDRPGARAGRTPEATSNRTLRFRAGPLRARPGPNPAADPCPRAYWPIQPAGAVGPGPAEQA